MELAIITAMHPLLAFARSKQSEIIAMIREMVECESPSDHPPSVNRFVDLLASKLEASQVRTFPGGRFGRHLRAEFTLPGPRKPREGRILALAHSDTVWPLGTLSEMPFREKKGRLWGPGVLDMKSGIVFFLYAVRALRELDIPVARRVTPAGEFGRRGGQRDRRARSLRKRLAIAPRCWCWSLARA